MTEKMASTMTPPPVPPAAPVTDDGTQPSLTTKEMRRIIGSSFMGSMIEFYDFVLYATAASIVFSQVFFAGLGPAFGLFASIATFTVGYIARPLAVLPREVVNAF